MAHELSTGTPKLKSVRAKIALVIAALAALVVSVEYALSVRETTDLARRAVVGQAREMTVFNATVLTGALRFGNTTQIATRFSELIDSDDATATYAAAFDANAGLLTSLGDETGVLPALTALARTAIETGEFTTSADGLLTVMPVFYSKDRVLVGAVAMAWSVEPMLVYSRAANRQMLLLSGLVFTVGMIAAVFVVQKMLINPLVRLRNAVGNVAAGDLETEIPARGRSDEVGGIAQALDGFRRALVQAQQNQRDSNYRSMAFKASNAAIMIVGLDLRIREINASLHNMFQTARGEFERAVDGFDPDDVTGHHIDTFHPPETRGRVRELVENHELLPYRAEISVGEARFSLVINLVTDDSGAAQGYTVEWIDMTREFMNHSVMAAIDANQIKADFSLSGHLLGANQRFCDMIGTPEQDLVGRHNSEIFSFNEKIARDRGPVFDRLIAGESIYGRFELALGNGRAATLDGGFTPVLDSRGEVLNIVLIGADVTEARAKIEAAEARQRQMQEAQATVVDALSVALEKLSDGDLTARIDSAFAPAYEALRKDYNTALEKLLEAMRGVIDNADLIQGEAAEISNAADDLSVRTEKQAATLEQTAAALDQLTSSVRSAADGANHANELVETARRNAEESGQVVREAVGAMSEIETSSNQISKITGVIDDIAFQTNLLALNAGVEAARAGDAGRGFAVVASEVRALAQRSSDAAREINELITASGEQVKRGVDLVDQAGKALAGIVDSVKEISGNVHEIAVSSREQSAGLAEINSAVNQLDQVTQQNAAMFEETTAASHALNREAETLSRTMARFRVGNGEDQAEATVIRGAFQSGRRQDPEDTTDTRVPAAAPQPAVAAAVAVAAVPPPHQTVTSEDDGWDDF